MVYDKHFRKKLNDYDINANYLRDRFQFKLFMIMFPKINEFKIYFFILE